MLVDIFGQNQDCCFPHFQSGCWLSLHIYRSGVRVVSVVSSKQAYISQMLNYPFEMRSYKFMSEHLHDIFQTFFFPCKETGQIKTQNYPRRLQKSLLKLLFNWPLNLAQLLQEGTEAWQLSSGCTVPKCSTFF